ncbi:MAG TPA: proprotein convertase P-domain-containing protein [Candidatus Hydrogenedens sp.]|nr:proprotein convertase P-domain-containing protein [Candidatus Hydrogenedens sp.]
MNISKSLVVIIITIFLLLPHIGYTDRIDVDYDYIIWAIDYTLDDMAPGRFAHLYGADRDGNGLKEEDHLGLLSAVLLNNSPDLPLARVIAIQEGFRANMQQVERDLNITINVLGQTFHFDVINELRNEDPLLAFAVQYFLAGYMTCGDSVTFNFLNSFLKDLVRYFAEREGYGWALDYINLNDYINFGPSRYVTFGNTGTNYLGAGGDIEGDGVSNIQEYSGSGTREVWFSRCNIVPPPRIVGIWANPGVVDTGDQATLTVQVVGGSGPLTFQWLRTDSNGYSFPSSFELVGPNSSTYVIPYATSLDNARFSIAVSDSASVYNPSARLGGRQSWGVYLGVRRVPLQILIQPVGGLYNVGEQAVLLFKVKGGTTVPTYYWSHNGVVEGPNSNQWIINPVTGSSQGAYQCRAVSGSEQVISQEIYLDVFGAGEIVHFEDPNLEAAVRDALGFDQTKEIYEGDLVAIKTLNGKSRGIQNLAGIYKIRNLENLNLWNNFISDLSPLSSLFNLKTLNIGRNNISDISPLQNLESLNNLYLWDNQITDLTALIQNNGLGSGDEIGLEGNSLPESVICEQIPLLEEKGCIVHYDGICPSSGLEGTLEGEGEEEEGEGEEGEGQPTEGEGEIQYPECDIEIKTTHFSTLLDPGNSFLPLNVPVSKIINNVCVRVTVTHSDVSQLRMKLISPNGTEVLLFISLPLGGENMINTVFTDTSSVPIDSASSPYTGEFAPIMPLSTFQGENMYGRWTLQVADAVSGEVGRVEEWALIFNKCQEEGEGTTEGQIEEGTIEGITEGQPEEGEGEIIYHHSLDSNGNWQIELVELLRAIQFYNVGGYSCKPGTEDGYAPIPDGPRNCRNHSADYNPADFNINLYEVLRVIQLFNSAGGYYHCDPNSEDGFAPGLE